MQSISYGDGHREEEVCVVVDEIKQEKKSKKSLESVKVADRQIFLNIFIWFI